MAPHPLAFEQPAVQLEDHIASLDALARREGLDLTAELALLRRQLALTWERLHAHPTPDQRLQICCHPHRPRPLDYAYYLLRDFVELHGDRNGADDAAVVGGPALFAGRPLMFIGTQNGRRLQERLRRNFAMPHPAGYRKAVRLMQLAARRGLPVLLLVDTCGAYPGVEAEKAGQASALARCLADIAVIPVPVVVALTGQAFNAGALPLSLGDRVFMQENACRCPAGSPLLDPSVLDIDGDPYPWTTAQDFARAGWVDAVVPEPRGGAHRDAAAAATLMRPHLARALDQTQAEDVQIRLGRRYERLTQTGQPWAAAAPAV